MSENNEEETAVAPNSKEFIEKQIVHQQAMLKKCQDDFQIANGALQAYQIALAHMNGEIKEQEEPETIEQSEPSNQNEIS